MRWRFAGAGARRDAPDAPDAPLEGQPERVPEHEFEPEVSNGPNSILFAPHLLAAPEGSGSSREGPSDFGCCLA